MELRDLELIRFLLWGRTFPRILSTESIRADDTGLRQLGFIPAFLAERTPKEIFAFMSMTLVDKGPADLVWHGSTLDVAPLGFYVGDAIFKKPWVKIGKQVWQLCS